MKPLTAIVLAMFIFGAPVAAQSLMLDCTGSMANPEKVEAGVVTAIANATPIVITFDVSLFSASPLSAPAHTVAVNRQGGRSRIEYVNKGREAQLRDDIKGRLEALLATGRPEPASITNLAAALLRAAEMHPALVVTDGKDETGKLPVRLQSGLNVFVILCPAKGDNPAREIETFEARKRVVVRMLPEAAVFGCYQTQRAVQAWASRANSSR